VYVTSEDVMHGRAKKAYRMIFKGKNLCTKRLMEKLDQRMCRPFVVTRKAGFNTNEIELPVSWEIDPVFYDYPLKPYCEDPIGRPQKIFPTPDLVDNDPSYVVTAEVDNRLDGN